MLETVLDEKKSVLLNFSNSIISFCFPLVRANQSVIRTGLFSINVCHFIFWVRHWL